MEKKMSKKADSELNKIKNEMPSDENELEELKKDIKDELARKNKYGKYYDDLVDTYISYTKFEKELLADIDKRGLRIRKKRANGTTTYIFNESIEYLFKTNYQRLQILNSLCIIDFNPKIIPTEDEKKERDLL